MKTVLIFGGLLIGFAAFANQQTDLNDSNINLESQATVVDPSETTSMTSDDAARAPASTINSQTGLNAQAEAPAQQPTKTPEVKLSEEFVKSLHKIGDLYRHNDCESQYTSQTNQNLEDACAQAVNNPQVVATKGNISCVYDSQSFTVSTNEQGLMPQFEIQPEGVVSKITKGDLSVASSDCKSMEVGRHPSSGHPASEELCLSYFPDKYFSKFQTSAECVEHKAL